MNISNQMLTSAMEKMKWAKGIGSARKTCCVCVLFYLGKSLNNMVISEQRHAANKGANPPGGKALWAEKAENIKSLR